MPPSTDLALAHLLADTADELTLARFRSPARSGSDRVKTDGSLVTEVDLAVERSLRALIAHHRPQDKVLAEEGGGPTRAERLWIIDPLDQTHNYARGLPEFATLIALSGQGRPSVAVVTAPALGRRWWAGAGQGAYSREGRLQVSDTDELPEAMLSVATCHAFARHGVTDRIHAIAAEARGTTGNGGFLGQMHVAEGRADAAIDPHGHLWDLAATSLIVTEAGGTFTTLDGARHPLHGSALAANTHLHARLLDVLGRPGADA